MVANAKVEAKNEETGVVFAQNTNQFGKLFVRFVDTGSYTITVTLAGFQTFKSVHNILTVGATLVGGRQFKGRCR